eukprot:scaffold7703_cov127-Cylindrotheca_fusiformis.AAC.2
MLWQKAKLGPKEPRGGAEVGGEVHGREKFPRSGGGVPIGSQRTRRAAARTGQKEGLPLRPWPITSPRTPFFCVVNSRVTKVAERRRWGGAVRESSRTPPRKNVVSARRKGDVSVRVPVYSPGRRRKKKARQSISAMHLAASVALGAEEAPMMCKRICTGTGFTREGVGSVLE